MQVKRSQAGNNYREIYSSGVYCGLIHVDAVDRLKLLETAVRRGSVFRRELVRLMSGSTTLMSADLQWRLSFKPFGSHLQIEEFKGLTWTPAAWSLVMRIAKRIDRD